VSCRLVVPADCRTWSVGVEDVTAARGRRFRSAAIQPLLGIYTVAAGRLTADQAASVEDRRIGKRGSGGNGATTCHGPRADAASAGSLSTDVSAMSVNTATRQLDEPSNAVLLEVSDLHVQFVRGDRAVNAVNGLSYSVDIGQTLAIIGESGSGKTASSRAIMGLLAPSAKTSGSIKFEGRELLGLSDKQMRRHRGPDMAMVFQDPARSLNPTMRIGSQIAEAIRAHEPMGKVAAHEKVIELLGRVRMSAPAQRYNEYPHQLSGGMRQRVMIAMALACHPKLLIADEATTALDVTTQAQIMSLLVELQRELGMAVVMISHDLGLAASYADQVIVMYAGRAVERADTHTLFRHVRMPYTDALLAAIPRIERPPHEKLSLIGGRPPDLSVDVEGCIFAPRCPVAHDDCRQISPVLEEHEPGHWWACRYPIEDRT
jgi:oligopeptide/dipeptide ABC transporter ATP-binding protein